MSSAVPEGWKTGNLSDVSEKIWIGLVTTMTKFYVKSGVPLIRNSDITQTGINPSKLIHLENAFANENKSRAVHKGDVVTVHTGDIGTSSVIEDELDGAQGFATLNTRLRQSSFNPYFYSYVLNSEQFKLIAQKVVTGDGRSNLNLKDFVNLPITYPILVNEQKKIASILTSVDEVIENTQKQIDKLQDLKKATMNELLTKGIGHTEFKDSELGRIPKSWEVRTVGELGSLKNGLNKPKESFGYGTKFVNISDAYPVQLNCDSLGRLDASTKEIKDYSLEGGDLVFVRSSVKLGGVAIPTEFCYCGEPVVFCGFMIRFRPHLKGLESSFLRQYLLNDATRVRIERLATGGANININQEALSQFKVLLPTTEEQKYFSSVNVGFEDSLQKYQEKLSQTQSLKKSLMQDLLTGKVRVTVN
ncbi:restriction endonuclease subunit S [Woeseiaceae bacterium]|nr:restriction endonuclease subunit S [Woeseiaceae bacterium]